MKASSRNRIITLALAGLGLIALLPATANAGPKDRDRDGLSNKRERKIGTNPRKADTDGDTLKDGREVKRTRTNPRRADTDRDTLNDGREIRLGLDPRNADTDGDGTSDRYERKGTIIAIEGESVTIQARYGSEITFGVDATTFIEGADRDGDGVLTLADFRIGDRVEVNLSADGSLAQTLELRTGDDDMNEAEGRITAIDGDSVTVARTRRGQVVTWTFTVDVDTFLRAPDRDGSGTVTVADFQVGDEVEAHLSADGTRALSMELEYDDDQYGDDDGYGDDDEGEIEGRIQAIDYGTGAITFERRGWTRTATANDSTFFRGLDRDASGTVDLADFQVGDRVEGRLSADGSTVLSLKLESDDDDDDGPGSGGSGRAEVEGTISGLDLASQTITVRRFNGTEVTLTAVAGTRYEVRDNDLSGTRDLADFQVGDRVEAKYDPSTNELLKLEYEGIDDDDDDDDDIDDDDDDDDGDDD